ncbi:uncharacterized protein METZ01_LOCUS416099, partial [marine metagenome]
QRKGESTEGEILIISTDSRRVGALAQSRAFAELIGIPLEMAHSVEDITEVLERYRNARLILIDTPGLGPHEMQEREHQRSIIEAAEVDEVQVVVDGLTGYEHMLDFVEASQTFASELRLLFAKMDEVVRPGAVLSSAVETGVPSSYFTTGPAIPGGISPGDLSRIAEWIAGRRERPFGTGD